ncbi:MAG: hypothetical protein Q609_ECAC02388G0001, partial [Escherichia coli DORA_A_5_14_21]
MIDTQLCPKYVKIRAEIARSARNTYTFSVDIIQCALRLP